ncbi:MFS transporter [Homoserinibacter sp. YIM 151385]|uniref:MFS transporter n=1 Tax=Homoserinibacter sp. YIM 151385 TaxID=2985506 RepID=UPI0022F04454|nr:MFS transporter [Homoserinibacter sp. YIM 151385]WBU39393.1 MFS transporter [Homoserinibacter sp. YIM 151385]
MTPLRRSPAFARLWIGATISGVGAQLTVVAVGLQLYDITRSTFAVALVGGIALVPMVIAGLWGGMLADAFDRRRVLIASAVLGWLATLGLVALSAADAMLVAQGGRVEVWPFYVLTTIASVAATVQNATRASVIPRILPTELVSRAAALNGIGFGFQLTVGPALAGVLVASIGFAPTFAVDAVLASAVFIGIVRLPKLPPLREVAKPGLRSLLDGWAFLRSAPNIRMSFLVDIVAMTFGRPFVLFPAVGATVIGGGPVTVGILTASMAIGTFLASLFSGPVAHVHRHGVAIGRAITVYGAFAGLFGVVVLVMQTGAGGPVGERFDQANAVALACAGLALVGMGASDEISAIFRSTMLLTAAPDDMRGRLQGVFTIVVTGGPRLGDLYAGILATALVLWFPPVLGGLLIMAIIAVLMRVQPAFRAYDARTPTR